MKCFINFCNKSEKSFAHTTEESTRQPNLKNMAEGLVQRYREAGKPPPKVIYTDRDCCLDYGLSKYQLLFEEWGEGLHALHTKDCWGRGTSESYPLYGPLMPRLSMGIFEWDVGDITQLVEAKKGELKASDIACPSTSAGRYP